MDNSAATESKVANDHVEEVLGDDDDDDEPVMVPSMNETKQAVVGTEDAVAAMEDASEVLGDGDESEGDDDTAAAAAAPSPSAATTAATGSPKSPGLSRRSSLRDDAWIAEQPDDPAAEPPKILRPTGIRSRSAVPNAATQANEAPKGASKQGLRGAAARLASKIHLVVGAIDKVSAFLVGHWEWCQLYVALVMFVFGSYFVQTIKCYEALVRT